MFAVAGSSTGEEPTETGASQAAPVVLELFTSQGCSSCPPADRLLSELGWAEGQRSQVIPLAYHVDYWNDLGWQDPFSQPRWSQRQRDYARAFGLGQVYTPQLVVNGRNQCAGSNDRQIRKYLDASRTQPVDGRLTLSANPLQSGGRQVPLHITAERSSRLLGKTLQVMVAVFENDQVTEVRRGENAGRMLRNDFVVRELRPAFSMPENAARVQEGSLVLELDAGWNTARLGIAAFLQDPDSMAMYGGATLGLSTAEPLSAAQASR